MTIKPDALQSLRIFGPCTASTVAEWTGLMPPVVEDDLERLARDGLATVGKDGLWDLTTQGVLEFEAICERAKKQRERDAACEGVRP